MKLKNALGFMAVFILLAACKQRQVTKAYVFERKHLPENKLQIKYRYVFNHTTFTDSAIINNIVLNSDSLPVDIDRKNPAQNFPVVENMP